MDLINIETMLFFGKKIVTSLREESCQITTIYDMGKPLYLELLEYLQENNEVSETELKKLQHMLAIFEYPPEEIQLMNNFIKEIQEGKSHWEPTNVELIEKMLDDHLIEEKETMRYLAHHNHFHQVVAWCEGKEELFSIARKYGSEKTRANFNNYETMKKLETKLIPTGMKSKKVKI